MVSFNSAGREGRPALALRIVHTGCTAGGLEHPRVVLVGLVFPASLLPVGRCFCCVDGYIPAAVRDIKQYFAFILQLFSFLLFLIISCYFLLFIMIYYHFFLLAGWPAGWLEGWLDGWLAGWPAGRLSG